MKIKVHRINSAKAIVYGSRVAIELDIDECNAEDIFRELWELQGDEFILRVLASEGWEVKNPNAQAQPPKVAGNE